MIWLLTIAFILTLVAQAVILLAMDTRVRRQDDRIAALEADCVTGKFTPGLYGLGEDGDLRG